MIKKWWSILYTYGNANWGKDSGHTLIALILVGVLRQWFDWPIALLIGATAAGTLKEIGDRIKAKVVEGKFFPTRWHHWDPITDWLTWQMAWPIVMLHQGEWLHAAVLSGALLVVFVPLVIRKYTL